MFSCVLHAYMAPAGAGSLQNDKPYTVHLINIQTHNTWDGYFKETWTIISVKMPKLEPSDIPYCRPPKSELSDL